jgi:hypothetical protein
MSDRTFWWSIRRALLMICAAIEKKYGTEDEPER